MALEEQTKMQENQLSFRLDEEVVSKTCQKAKELKLTGISHNVVKKANLYCSNLCDVDNHNTIDVQVKRIIQWILVNAKNDKLKLKDEIDDIFIQMIQDQMILIHNLKYLFEFLCPVGHQSILEHLFQHIHAHLQIHHVVHDHLFVLFCHMLYNLEF